MDSDGEDESRKSFRDVDVEPGQGRQAASPDYGLGSPSCLVIESKRLMAGGWGLSRTMPGGQMDHEAEQERQL